MAQQGNRRGVSYYYRLDFHTLQGKITSGFSFLGVFATVLMAFASVILKPALEKSQYVANVINASDHQLLLLKAQTDKVVALSEIRIAKQESISREELNKHARLIQSPLDSLTALSREWKSTEAELCLKVAALKTETLLKKLKELGAAGASENAAEFLNNEVYPLQLNIADQVAKIHNINAAEKANAQAYINLRTDNLVWILLGALILSIATGAIIASYIVIRVLREIRMLKNKIFELSEGKLIEPIPNNRNELNSIIKAVNLLNENLHNIEHFAKEVGKGNFDTNISVFEGQNDLGESLAGMRDSLKAVALEEKHRNWVTSGLAHFSELLRNSTDNMNSYYQKIISELVRYLNINQAAIYVVKDTDGEDTVLDMKASYAYGRLKYLHKEIAPGQGLAGQVFLEKEPLFLKSIPGNYLQISSGLGEATPNNLALVPLKVNNEANGVLELASFHPLAPHEIEFLLKIAENISSAIQNVSNMQTTALLLQEAQSMTQAMQSQEEMLRQNTEELIATQEQLSRDLQESNQKMALLEQSSKNSPIPQLLISNDGTVELANKQACELLQDQLQGRHISTFFDQELINMLQSNSAGSSNTISYKHPAKGTLLLLIHSFSTEQSSYTNLQIISQSAVSLV